MILAWVRRRVEGAGKGGAARADGEAGELAWDYSQPEEWARDVARFEQVWLDEGRTVRLQGYCPRCTEHWIDIEIPVKARTGVTVNEKRNEQQLVKRRRLGPDARKQFKVVAFCNCGAHHENRPADAPHGCGAFGSLLVG